MRKSILFVIAISCTACAGGSSGETGTAVARISSVPANALCLDVSTVGASRTVDNKADLTPGSVNVVVRLANLPAGSDLFFAAAYPVSCSSIAGAQPSWLTPNGVPANIAAGGVTSVALTLEPTGGANVGINFDGDGGTVTPLDLGPCNGDSGFCGAPPDGGVTDMARLADLAGAPPDLARPADLSSPPHD